MSSPSCLRLIHLSRHAFLQRRSCHSKATNSKKPTSKARLIDQLGTWDSSTPVPAAISKDYSIQRGNIIPTMDATTVGVCTKMGRRSYQEDRYTVTQVLDNLLLLAVWDGHGGAECADYCAQHVEKELNKEIEWHGEQVELGAALKSVILRLNNSFEKHWEAVKTKKRQRAPGSTATIAAVRDGYELVVAHVGDSRALLCREGEARRLTRDHCPSDPDERQRVEENGGTVVYDTVGRYMVNNRLSMSRSIGDFDLKPYGVTAEPELIRKNFKHGKDKFLVLTTDGINFVMTDEEVVECVSCWDKADEAAARLVDQSLLYASEDNVTALVLPLGSWRVGDDTRSMMYSLGKNMKLSSRFG